MRIGCSVKKDAWQEDSIVESKHEQKTEVGRWCSNKRTTDKVVKPIVKLSGSNHYLFIVFMTQTKTFLLCFSGSYLNWIKPYVYYKFGNGNSTSNNILL